MRNYTKRLILKLYRDLQRFPNVVIFIFPGQPPGKYFAEHDRRIIKAIKVWDECLALPCKVTILCTSGPADKDGLTCAKYMKNQLLYFSKKYRYSDINIEPFIEIGEEKSGGTAQQMLFAKKDFETRKPNLVILITNRPHLLVAASYYKRIVGGRFVKEWSENSDGCIGMPLWKFVVREIQHYVASVTIDRKGEHFTGAVRASVEKWRKLSYPTIPPE